MQLVADGAVCAVILVLLMISEWWWRRQEQTHIKGEVSRKFVHVTVGCFVAFWPFFLSWNQILLLSAGFLVVTLVSKYLNLFKAIHSVQRPTWGELFFAVAVGAVALMTHHKAVYAVALLQMSLADGLAAVIGLKFGLKNRYKVFGCTKSVAGTLTFFVVSFVLLAGFHYFVHDSLPGYYLIALAAAASLIENAGVYGLDNLLVPLLIAVALNY